MAGHAGNVSIWWRHYEIFIWFGTYLLLIGSLGITLSELRTIWVHENAFENVSNTTAVGSMETRHTVQINWHHIYYNNTGVCIAELVLNSCKVFAKLFNVVYHTPFVFFSIRGGLVRVMLDTLNHQIIEKLCKVTLFHNFARTRVMRMKGKAIHAYSCISVVKWL